jgi:hypothetical protein
MDSLMYIKLCIFHQKGCISKVIFWNFFGGQGNLRLCPSSVSLDVSSHLNVKKLKLSL